MWRKLATLASAGLVLAAAACSSASGSDKVTLTYAVWDKNQVPAIEKTAAEFSKQHKDISIKVQLTAPTKDYWTKLQTSVSGGSAPDVFWMNAPNVGLYASEGVLLPMTEQIKEDKVDLGAYPESLVDIYRLDGEQYALPKDFDTIGLWYNKQLFDAAKVDYPDDTWTWDDLVAAAKQLTDPSKGQYGIAAPQYSQENYYNTIFQAGGEVISADGTSSGYGSPQAQQGVQFWVDLIHKHKVSPTAEQMSDTEPNQLFSSGKVAMFYGGSWEAIGFHQNADIRDKINVAPLPRGEKQAVVIHGLGNAISAKTAHPDEAWEWVTFLASERGQQIQAETGTVISAYQGTQETWVKAMPEYDLRVFLDQVEHSVPYPRSKNSSAWTEDEEKLLGEAWAGKKPVSAALRELAAAMDSDLAEE